jgi:hypothetical protein
LSEEDQSEEERLALVRLDDQKRSICRKQIKGHSSLLKSHVDKKKSNHGSLTVSKLKRVPLNTINLRDWPRKKHGAVGI